MHIDFHVLFIMFTFSQNDNRYSVDLFKKQHTQCMHNVQASAPRALLYFLTPLMSYLIFPFSYLWFLVQWISVVFEFFINCSVLICGNHKFCEDTCNSKDGFVCSMNSVRPQKTQVQLKSVLLLVIEFFCFFYLGAWGCPKNGCGSLQCWVSEDRHKILQRMGGQSSYVASVVVWKPQ